MKLSYCMQSLHHHQQPLKVMNLCFFPFSSISYSRLELYAYIRILRVILPKRNVVFVTR